MTTEEKAKAYDEALEKARKRIMTELQGHTDAILKDIFSELNESEDERIRKEIINYLNFAESHNLLRTTDCGKKKEWIVYLEKQKEQKEINLVNILKHYPKETELYSPLYGKLWLAEVDGTNEIITCYKHPLEKDDVRATLEQEDTVSFFSNGTTGLPDFEVSKDCMLFLYNNEKQKEPKPEIKYVYPIFRVGDTIKPKVYNESHRINKIKDDNYVLDNGFTFPIVDQDVWEIVEQKPAEKLSKEEYVKKFKALCNAYEIKLPNREYDIYGLCEDLHKLFGDIQKPAEWSEEDENIYNKALDAIYYKDLNDKYEVDDALKALCDLISRKRKVIPPYARWKPSEEQMNALKVVARGYPADDIDAVESLLNELQKLVS